MSALVLADAKKCVMYDRKTVSDGEGGFVTALVPGAEFMAHVVLEDGRLEKVAQAITQAVEYKAYTPKTVTLKSGDIFKRLEDGKAFEVLLDNTEKQPPASSSLSYRYTTVKPYKGSLEDQA